MTSEPGPLLSRSTCPHCWTRFAPEDVLWVSSHADLLGDPRLGPDHPQRFLPSRFDLAGNALDARGLACTMLGCPRCHLPLPRAVLEIEPAFVSILGTPACGKSFYLAALTWGLRHTLPAAFGVSFADADPVTNRTLNEYEEQLFLNPAHDRLVPVGDLIRKTQVQGDLYDTVSYGSQEVSYPRPFLFTLRPQAHHPRHAEADRLGRLLCVYDNAGESFQPGADSTRNPVTRHVAQAQLLLFLFDPTQDVRFRALCQPALPPGHTSRQESVLLETADRVRRLTGLAQGAKHDRPLVVVLTKFDAWRSLLDDQNVADPWKTVGRVAGLDPVRIDERSAALRSLLRRVCPEVVSAAEGFAREVVYVPVSALGRSPVPDPATGRPSLRPGDIKPLWATVPLLFGLSRYISPGLVPVLRRTGSGQPSGNGVTPKESGERRARS
jgi:hypothetical protein